MPYYSRPMGDYGTGGYGYPQGDPGLFALLAKVIPIAKKVYRMVKGVAAPVAAGAIGGAAIEAGQQIARYQPGLPPAPPTGFMPGVGQIGMAAGRGAVQARMGPAMAGACPTGYHLAKDGSGRWVRNRRMNVANPRALRRSIRRVKGFDKLARKSIKIIKRVK